MYIENDNTYIHILQFAVFKHIFTSFLYDLMLSNYNMYEVEYSYTT